MNDFEKMTDIRLIQAALWRIMDNLFEESHEAKLIRDELKRRAFEDPNELKKWIAEMKIKNNAYDAAIKPVKGEN